ncbi:hemerythrin domain-containing protein [Aquabacterium sp. A08]|uniref:hemerythrin domain-containing protein n=1 Tax=Aquabacterium sp. A08 TaxID=2718532 RepID=UPI00141FA142|nr:hemerythrin domain-containing protein [Aquabacterium sp. A08]NIC42186.1 hemerythrin domain-containing protein [Aquabacterium sp. A08]NIC43614.1 hemerythrin domain-containing protein [Aquabacterium sp. A08]
MTLATPVQDEPIQDFTQCHAGIVRKLDTLAELPALLAPAARAREIAEQAVDFFREAIFEHHLDEERELFPAVLASAEKGAEWTRVQAMVQRLTDEHRALEQVWKRLEPGLKKLAKGQPADVDVAAIDQLVGQYQAHARYEEAEFLPLSQTILGRNANHMAALGMSLHMRHNRAPLNAYV